MIIEYDMIPGQPLTDEQIKEIEEASKRKPVFENIYAGLSGPAIKPIALRMVHEVCKNVSIPVMGMGGITTAQDAIEFIMAGATCIQVGTANFMNPKIGLEIIDGIEEKVDIDILS